MASPAGDEATDAAFELLESLVAMSDRFYRVAGDDQAVSPDWTRASAKEMAACVADTSPSRARLASGSRISY